MSSTSRGPGTGPATPTPVKTQRGRRWPLAEAIDFHLSEMLRYDLGIGILGGIGGAIRWSRGVTDMVDFVGVVAGIVGVIIGAVLAAASIQAAFMDTSFLRKIQRLGYRPSHFLAPALFTGVIGVAATIATIVLISLPEGLASGWKAGAGGVAGFLVLYTIASLIPVLRMIVEFSDLKATAAQLPDE